MADTVLAAQQVALDRVGFFIAKAHFYDRHREQLNDRQAKAIERMFREGRDGFEGGLSAGNHLSITGTSRATATRDLQDLVEMGTLIRTGERRYTRYWLNLDGTDDVTAPRRHRFAKVMGWMPPSLTASQCAKPWLSRLKETQGGIHD